MKNNNKEKKNFIIESQPHILLQTHIIIIIYRELNRDGNDTEIAAMEICYFLYQTCQFEELRRLKLPNTPGGGSESPSAADSQVCQRDSSVIGG